ncbi:phage/plasmid replication domain-containing protein [Pseudomonas syringae]|uniref:Phage X family protein n=1 Tax=Pseudomonas syringae TaxID=317 RepID=A0AB38C2A3_PSESX|nr:phage/plasmid replication protein [Pseudomonas syringae]SFO61612.1 Phage X family protein [Pseudomonas syringae]SFP11244.1 Phage X family protein [Pseudomonas syringae]
MFIDWLKVSQEFDYDLPVISDTAFLAVDTMTHEILSTSYRSVTHEGSHSSSVKIRINGRKITIDGNPSRINRHDNLFGFDTIEQCISVYNDLLAEYGLPAFTRCTRFEIRQGESGAKSSHVWADGCCIHRIDLTTNIAVGEGNEMAYLRALATQRIGHSIGFLYREGHGMDWTTSGNGKGARLQYRKAYDKAYEIMKNHLPKVKRVFGEDSPEFKYAQQIYDYCVSTGIVRMEQELKDEYLKRENLSFWGLFDEGMFKKLHDEFLIVDQRLTVQKMDMASIAQQLLLEGIVPSPRAANQTAYYAILWMQDQQLVCSQRTFETHAARLNRIGINIRNQCDITTFSTVFIREMREINPQKSVSPPNWYKRPNHLRAA